MLAEGRMGMELDHIEGPGGEILSIFFLVYVQRPQLKPWTFVKNIHSDLFLHIYLRWHPYDINRFFLTEVLCNRNYLLRFRYELDSGSGSGSRQYSQHSFPTTKICTKYCLFNVKSIISQKVSLSFLIFRLPYSDPNQKSHNAFGFRFR